MQLATFGAGCFWGVQDQFNAVKGIVKTTVGYMGGKTKNPTYEQVCTGSTGHVEVCQVEFDPRKVSYEKLLDLFWQVHDPTQLNRQGPDVGRQYRSVIFYHTEEQHQLAKESKSKIQKSYKPRIATTIEPAAAFYLAEEYHQHYRRKTGRKVC
ncbi:MAG TPA: peptide-methionine (S)-S-oxide reductase MsrA [Candidatus Nanoarchaeia archaeon]|nr:peptide-methionine (S)-S-oxide reductase MsrA [Candidatus Nanoarchaeia archaeon]